MNKCILVIGAGPAGMMAAATAAARGARVVLLERNEKLGKKLYITGKGRCNLTNAIPIEDFFEQIPRNRKFLYGAFYALDNQALIDLLGKYGLKTQVERGQRVFPVSNHASDVTKALTRYLEKTDVEVQLNTRVRELWIRENEIAGVILENGEKRPAEAVIVATGGKSYPQTGSTGDGYRMASKAGHHVTALRPSLIPIRVAETWVPELSGLDLKNITLTARVNGKKVFSELGEMQFAHFGITGPLVLSASAHLVDKPIEKAVISLDLKPGLSDEKLDERLKRDLAQSAKKAFKNALDGLFPKRLIPVMITLSGIAPNKVCGDITREERRGLLALCKALPLHPTGFLPLEAAIVTRGGISIKEIDPSSMQSKLVKGLYFAGEIIDVDGYTGGFNLQIAFSTGYLAGNSC